MVWRGFQPGESEHDMRKTPLMDAAVAPPTAEQIMATLPKEAPVRVLDERGHLRTLEDIEHDLIELAIQLYSGHMSEVARRLGIGRSTLYRKVREQGIEVVDEAM